MEDEKENRKRRRQVTNSGTYGRTRQKYKRLFPPLSSLVVQPETNQLQPDTKCASTQSPEKSIACDDELNECEALDLD